MKKKLIATFATLGIFSTGVLSASLEMPKTNYKAQEERASPEVKAKLKSLREQIRASGKKMGVSATQPMFLPEKDLTGEIPKAIHPEIIKLQNNAWDEINGLIASMGIISNCPAPIAKQSYERNGSMHAYMSHMPPIRNQNPCGSCTAHSAAAVTEIGYILQDPNPRANSTREDLSEEQLMNCQDNSILSCGGGQVPTSLDYILNNGVLSEAQRPYTAIDNDNCPTDGGANKILAWNFVPSRQARLNSGATYALNTDADIKRAIARSGSVSISYCSRDAWQGYDGTDGQGNIGVLQDIRPRGTNCGNGGATNHAVSLVGWDDKKDAWIMRNSWGTNWGNNGYAYIKRGDFNQREAREVRVERSCQRQSKNWKMFDLQRRGILDKLNDRMKRYR